MTTTEYMGLGLLLIVVLAAAFAWKRSKDAADRERWWAAYDAKQMQDIQRQRAARARDDFLAAELKAQIDTLKARKKRHSHLVAELQALTNRRLLWERGA